LSDSASLIRSLLFILVLSGRVPGHMTISTLSPSRGTKRSAFVLFFSTFLDHVLILYHYSSCCCCCCCCWDDCLQTISRALSFQIGSGWNLAGLFIK